MNLNYGSPRVVMILYAGDMDVADRRGKKFGESVNVRAFRAVRVQRIWITALPREPRFSWKFVRPAVPGLTTPIRKI